MAARRPSRPFLTLVWFALVAGCGRTVLYGEQTIEEDPLGNGGEGADSSGGTRAGRGGRNGTAGDASATGGSNSQSGGTSTVGGNASGATGGRNSVGGSLVTGGTSNAGVGADGGSSTTGGTNAGGVSGVGADAGQGGNVQAGKGGEAGEPNDPGPNCSENPCEEGEFCCVGLTATACLPEGTDCNGAVLGCSAPSSCDGAICCLTMGGGMASSECTDDCSNNFPNGSGRLRLRLCASDDDCTPNRECRMTFVGVTACMRRL